MQRAEGVVRGVCSASDDARFGGARPGDGVDGVAWLWPQAVVAVIVAGRCRLEFGVETGFAVDDDAPGSSVRGTGFWPVRSEVVGIRSTCSIW